MMSTVAAALGDTSLELVAVRICLEHGNGHDCVERLAVARSQLQTLACSVSEIKSSLRDKHIPCSLLTKCGILVILFVNMKPRLGLDREVTSTSTSYFLPPSNVVLSSLAN